MVVDHRKIAVVGGGAVGLATAAAVAERTGAEVALFEMGRLASASSAQITGGTRDLFPSPPLVALNHLSRELLLGDDGGRRLGWTNSGYLMPACSTEEVERLQRNAAIMADCGARLDILDPAEVARHFPWLSTEGLLAAAHGPEGCTFRPRSLIDLLIRRCRDNGVAIHEESEVQYIDVEGGSHELVFRDGRRRFDAVISAVAGWTTQLLGDIGKGLPIVATVGQVFRVPLPPGVPLPAPLTTEYLTTDGKTTVGAYFRPGPDGLVMAGMDTDLAPSLRPTVNMADGSRIAAGVRRWIPTLPQQVPTEGWAGVRDKTPDDLGVIGELPGVPGLYVAAGFGSHGFMHAVAIGDVLADMVAGVKPKIDPEPFNPARFG